MVEEKKDEHVFIHGRHNGRRTKRCTKRCTKRKQRQQRKERKETSLNDSHTPSMYAVIISSTVTGRSGL